MRAVVLNEPEMVEVTDQWPEPTLGADEVLVAVHAVGLCGSDLGVYDGQRPTPTNPWVMGHEGGGTIVAVGTAVRDREVGQRVVIEPNYCCGHCPHCRRGHTSSCVDRRVVGMTTPGVLAERVAVPAAFAWPVGDRLSDHAVACIEPLAVARSSVRRSGVGPGDTCLVVGAGSQGLFTCMALLARGLEPAIVEPHEGRRALAVEIGATATDGDRDGTYTYVFETAGVPAALDTALTAVAPAGTVVMIGMGHQAVAMSSADIVRRQLTLQGMLIYDHPVDFAETIAVVQRGEIEPSAVVKAVHPVGAAPTAFAAAPSVAGKSLIDLRDWRVETP